MSYDDTDLRRTLSEIRDEIGRKTCSVPFRGTCRDADGVLRVVVAVQVEADSTGADTVYAVTNRGEFYKIDSENTLQPE